MDIISWNNGAPTKAFLLKSNIAYEGNKNNLRDKYMMPLAKIAGRPISKDTGILSAYYPKTGTVKKKELVEVCTELLDYCDTTGIDTLYIGDTKYFEYLSGAKGLEKQIGNILHCVHSGYEHIKIFPVLNYLAIEMTPEKQALQDKAFQAIADDLNGTYREKQEFQFNSYKVLEKPSELQELLKYPELAIDIETTGLRFEQDELGTIAFSWSEYDAVSIKIHRNFVGEEKEQAWKEALKKFFEEYKGKKIFHNASFDVKFLVYHLFMEDLYDNEGRTYGARCLADENIEDTMIIAFLCLNSTSRTPLGLKGLSFEFLGNYAEDVKDIMKVPIDDLLVYNAKDTCGTFWVYNKYNKILDEENQRDVYNKVFRPSLNMLINMMLSGLPLDIERVTEVDKELSKVYAEAETRLNNNDYVKLALKQLKVDAAEKYNSTHKVKQKTIYDFSELQFNPNSSNQLRLLLFDVMGYDPIEFTDKGAPKTNRASIQEFYEFEEDAQRKDVLEALIDISKTSIVISTFLGAFKNYWINREGQHYDDWLAGDVKEPLGLLHGNLNIAKVTSGRLSSTAPYLNRAA